MPAFGFDVTTISIVSLQDPSVNSNLYVPFAVNVKFTVATPAVVAPKVAPVGLVPNAAQVPVVGKPVNVALVPPQATWFEPAVTPVQFGFITKSTLLVSFNGFISGVVLLIDFIYAVFTPADIALVVALLAVTVNLIVSLCPDAIVGIVQSGATHVPLVVVLLTGVTPAGNTSFTTTLVAVPGPALNTATV